MSSLQRSAMSARIAKLPHIPPEASHAVSADMNEEQDEENDDIGELPSSMGPPKQASRTANRSKTTDSEFSPISAAAYFTQAVQIDVPSSQHSFRVYYTPPKVSASKGSVMVCHHGAGFSGLSFASFAKEVERLSNGECGVLAVDAREHGRTSSTVSDCDLDLSVERLSADLVELLKTTFPSPSEAPTLLLVGHSMGGSVIVRACGPLLESKYKIAGVAVLDVVEGFSLEALPHMHKLLDSRPSGFDTQEEAIKWHILTNTIRNPQSARISVPPIFVPADSPSSPGPAWKWRTPLHLTAPFWPNWFTGLSSRFLAARTARLLVLAGTDRLDKELMIGQMQGKFQMVVIPDVGHMVHEDNPTRLAEILVEFWKRNDRVVIGVKKVGEA